MYIKSAEIKNIRSIDNFKIEFENPAGWHVLIGDNGSGKSTIIRSMALALAGTEESLGLRADWDDWLNKQKEEGHIILSIEASEQDKPVSNEQFLSNKIPNITIQFKRIMDSSRSYVLKASPSRRNIISSEGWFSVAYGPYRRFSGGNQEWSKVFTNQPRLGAHLSAFGEDVALTEPIEWLMNLNYQELEQKLNAPTVITSTKGFQQESYLFEESYSVLGGLKTLINSPDFLPNNTKLESVSSKGVLFKDGNGNLISVNQLSDGYRSILSLTFELIRQLIKFYGDDAVFENIRKDDMRITLPGVVLIDEIDAHLHPTWQTRIGQWFLKYLPNIQFIVTTHSPLVCRAAEKGTIWKLAAPGSEEKSVQVTGVDRQRLIFGNILDAYGTEVFGEDVSRSEKSAEMLKELAALSVKSFKGKITDSERKRADQLKQILPTE